MLNQFVVCILKNTILEDMKNQMDTKITESMLQEAGYKLSLWLLEATVSGQKYTEAWKEPQKFYETSRTSSTWDKCIIEAQAKQLAYQRGNRWKRQGSTDMAREKPNIPGQCERFLLAQAM